MKRVNTDGSGSDEESLPCPGCAPRPYPAVTVTLNIDTSKANVSSRNGSERPATEEEKSCVKKKKDNSGMEITAVVKISPNPTFHAAGNRKQEDHEEDSGDEDVIPELDCSVKGNGKRNRNHCCDCATNPSASGYGDISTNNDDIQGAQHNISCTDEKSSPSGAMSLDSNPDDGSESGSSPIVQEVGAHLKKKAGEVSNAAKRLPHHSVAYKAWTAALETDKNRESKESDFVFRSGPKRLAIPSSQDWEIKKRHETMGISSDSQSSSDEETVQKVMKNLLLNNGKDAGSAGPGKNKFRPAKPHFKIFHENWKLSDGSSGHEKPTGSKGDADSNGQLLDSNVPKVETNLPKNGKRVASGPVRHRKVYSMPRTAKGLQELLEAAENSELSVCPRIHVFQKRVREKRSGSSSDSEPSMDSAKVLALLKLMTQREESGRNGEEEQKSPEEIRENSKRRRPNALGEGLSRSGTRMRQRPKVVKRLQFGMGPSCSK